MLNLKKMIKLERYIDANFDFIEEVDI